MEQGTKKDCEVEQEKNKMSKVGQIIFGILTGMFWLLSFVIVSIENFLFLSCLVCALLAVFWRINNG